MDEFFRIISMVVYHLHGNYGDSIWNKHISTAHATGTFPDERFV
jgi:hypothetical protein